MRIYVLAIGSEESLKVQMISEEIIDIYARRQELIQSGETKPFHFSEWEGGVPIGVYLGEEADRRIISEFNLKDLSESFTNDDSIFQFESKKIHKEISKIQ